MASTSVMSSVRADPKPPRCSRALNNIYADLDLFPAIGFPDPFAVATINGEQTKTTSVSKRTLNPYWNESFDLYARP